jgi:hypothetical protein
MAIFLLSRLFSNEKTDTIRKMIRERDILEALRAGEVELRPLQIELVGVEPRLESHRLGGRPDAYVDIRWGERAFRFVAELKVQATPRTFREALDQLRRYAEASEMRPLLVTTYLPPDRLDELEARGVSGLDLSGNGVVVIPGEVIVCRTGNPNRYPAGRKIRNVYQGASSLVARAFLLRPQYQSVQEVMDEISARGGRIALSTVSRVLKVLEEDLVIRREGRFSELLQADELFNRLAAGFKPPRIDARKKYRWSGDRSELLGRLGNLSGQLVLTGAASVEMYSVMPREKSVQCYCMSIEPIEQRLGTRLEESIRFPDLELVQTRDPTVYFDARTTNGVDIASPVQCWLELNAGDKRQQDASRSVRERVEGELRQQGWRAP